MEGRIQTGSYQNKNGDTVYTTDVIANRVEFLSGGGGNSGGGSGYGGNYGGGNYGNQPSGMGNSASSAPSSGQSSAPSGIPEGFEAIDDDDIPF